MLSLNPQIDYPLKLELWVGLERDFYQILREL